MIDKLSAKIQLMVVPQGQNFLCSCRRRRESNFHQQ
jgi:hypothetical protein